tara:strand:- start:63 stop:491 length:429 start_codon:yes stop_codon:yes gene_type:complete
MPKFKTLTKSQIEEIPKLAESLTTNQIADYFRICRTTFYEMRKSNPVIAEHYGQGKAKVIAQIAGSLITKAKGGDTSSQVFYLKTRAGWSEPKEELQIENAVEETLEEKRARFADTKLFIEYKADAKLFMEYKKERQLNGKN